MLKYFLKWIYMFILIIRKSSVFTNVFVTALFVHQLRWLSLFIAFETNEPSTHVNVRAKKAGFLVTNYVTVNTLIRLIRLWFTFWLNFCWASWLLKLRKIRNQYNQAQHLTQDIWESDKNTIKHHIRKSQEVSPFPAGDHMAAMKIQENLINMKHK